MKDLKSLFELASSPVGGEAVAAPNDVLKTDSQSASNKARTEDENADRYVAAMDALERDAVEQHALTLCVDIITWKLAAIAMCNGPLAAGEIIGRLGGHIKDLARRDNARREAEKSKKEGHKPH